VFRLGLGRGREEPLRVRGAPLRFDQPVPRAVLDRGFRFGHQILGNDHWNVVHFSFEFYGWESYLTLLNPHHPVTRAVLPAMVETGDYFFFALDSENSTTAFRSELGEGHLRLLREYLPLLRQSTTTDAQYEQEAVVLFGLNPHPPGVLLQWVCRNEEYLDLTIDRWELTPA
jgi:hypothetical protein